jgi:GPH family glycoside/pentoside/hexuronide:cation symporter
MRYEGTQRFISAKRSRPILASFPRDIPISGLLGYVAPIAGLYFFYIPMWSILPGIYAKYFGLGMTSVAAVVLLIRLFDGIVDTTVGYLADLHRSRGGSRKPWTFVGCLGSIIACYFLFIPPQPVSTTYYLCWSLAYFLALTIADIPHLTWGSELVIDYQRRAYVYGARNMMSRFGIVAFYSLPLLPFYSSTDYTPGVLRDAVAIGAIMSVIGLLWMAIGAPAGRISRVDQADSPRQYIQSFTGNRPLLIHFVAFGLVGLSYGMWFGLLYFYLDSYLGFGSRIALMFLLGFAVAALSTPLWLALIRATSKSAAWCTGIVLFVIQLVGMWFLAPGVHWWIPLGLVVLANLCFCCHDTAALAILGDIVDYGRLRFHRDRGSTYFAFNALVYKFGLGIGGGVAIGTAGLFGFTASNGMHSANSIWGLKLGFIVLPACFAMVGMLVIWRTPINKHRHQVICSRLESRELRRAHQATSPKETQSAQRVPELAIATGMRSSE